MKTIFRKASSRAIEIVKLIDRQIDNGGRAPIKMRLKTFTTR